MYCACHRDEGRHGDYTYNPAFKRFAGLQVQGQPRLKGNDTDPEGSLGLAQGPGLIFSSTASFQSEGCSRICSLVRKCPKGTDFMETHEDSST